MRLTVQDIQWYFPLMHLFENGPLDRFSHTVLIIAQRNEISTAFYGIRGISHGNTQTGRLKHGHISHTITNRHDFFCLHSNAVGNSSKGITLINTTGNHFQEETFRTENIKHTAQTAFPMGFQSGQCILVITHQHHLARWIIHGNGELFVFVHLHSINISLIDDMQIGGVVCHHPILIIGQYGEPVFACLLLQIRQHFRTDTPLKQHFAVCSADNLSAIVRQNKTSVVSHFQFTGQRQQTVSRTSGCQHEAYPRHLHLFQSSQRTGRNLSLSVQKCSVHIQNQ